MDVKTFSVNQQDLANDFIINFIIGEASDGRANGCSLGNCRRQYVLVQVTTDSDKLIGEASDGRANGCSLGNRRRRYVLVQVTTDSDKLCKYLCIDTYVAK